MIQNSENKVFECKKILDKYGCLPQEAAYIGDDLNDLEVMQYVGIRGCPGDAVNDIK